MEEKNKKISSKKKSEENLLKLVLENQSKAKKLEQMINAMQSDIKTVKSRLGL
tara:strand:+ start:289 stop:447 length:159 start_codon:yes stop_codon:yes gene_type:complete